MKKLIAPCLLGAALLLGGTMAQAEQIHDAARTGNLDEVKRLLKESPFLRKSIDGNGQTPAVMAAWAGQTAVVEYLLGAGVKVTDANPNGKNMLHAACEKGRLDLVKLLVLKYRAPVDTKDGNGWSAIHYASRQDPVDVLRFILDQKGNVNDTTTPGATPMIMAVAMKKQPQVQLLLERKADVNKADNGKRTPLHVAAKNKDKAMVELLLKAGARGGVKDKDGKTALDEAVAAQATEIIPLLEKSAGPARTKNRGP